MMIKRGFFRMGRIMAACAMLACVPASAATTVLYDYSLAPPNTFYTPAAARWMSAGIFGANEEFTAQGTRLSPTSLAGNFAYAGYANHGATITPVGAGSPPPIQVSTGALVNPAFPVLDRSAGFNLSFTFRMQDEDHSGNSNRAGFSVTLLDSEHKGVEIGFQSNLIFAQNDGTLGTNLFTAGEQTSASGHIAALGSFNNWNLSISNSGYSLTRAGSVVLSGALRDYSGYSGLGEDAYRTTNFLFVGDNTTSAGAITTLQYLAIGPAPVPEPSAYLMLLAGLGCISLVAYRRRTVRA